MAAAASSKGPLLRVEFPAAVAERELRREGDFLSALGPWQSGERLPSKDTLVFRPAPKIAVMGHRIREAAPIHLLRHFNRAKRSKMRRHELRVEQAEPAFRQPRSEMHESDFRGVGLAVKHAFAEKCRAEVDAIEPAGELAASPAFHRMNAANVEELAIEFSNPPIDPCLLAVFIGGGAGIDDRIEIAIDFDLETIGANRLGEAFRDDQAIEREDAARLRVDPEQIFIRGALRHREKADGIGAQQNVGGDLELVARTAHPARLSATPASVKLQNCRAAAARIAAA